MVSLGVLALALGVILRLTFTTTVGWSLEAVGFVLIVAGLLFGVVWRLSRTRRRGTAH